jgi:hypothetical protein
LWGCGGDSSEEDLVFEWSEDYESEFHYQKISASFCFDKVKCGETRREVERKKKGKGANH